ncbi:unnamed protein product [Ectocarpus sp. 12 AP-2014]
MSCHWRFLCPTGGGACIYGGTSFGRFCTPFWRYIRPLVKDTHGVWTKQVCPHAGELSLRLIPPCVVHSAGHHHACENKGVLKRGTTVQCTCIVSFPRDAATSTMPCSKWQTG